MFGNKHILIGFRLVVGGVFIWAGLLKIFDPLGFAESIANYKVFPAGMSFFLALVLPWIEVICGVFLILDISLCQCPSPFRFFSSFSGADRYGRIEGIGY